MLCSNNLKWYLVLSSRIIHCYPKCSQSLLSTMNENLQKANPIRSMCIKAPRSSDWKRLHIKEEHRKIKINHQRRVQKERRNRAEKKRSVEKVSLPMAINQQETRYNVKEVWLRKRVADPNIRSESPATEASPCHGRPGSTPPFNSSRLNPELKRNQVCCASLITQLPKEASCPIAHILI